jgi:5-oxoprolinase (ATP-hydrolysing) subunit C
MSEGLQVKTAGPLSTVQDAGRFGWQRFGVSVSGAFDSTYLAVANRLVGNAPGDVAIEMTLRGDSYVVTAKSCRIALAGDFALSIDGEPAAAWRSHRLVQGQALKLGGAKRDLRGYLAVAGGFALAPTLGSLATHVRTGIGGFNGRALKSGDVLPLLRESAEARREAALDVGLLPERSGPIRVVLGPQDDHFTAAGIATFLDSAYAVTGESDRVGYRLSGAKIEHRSGYNIISDGIPTGAVQVPGSGEPIVLMIDRQTTGGYPKIATVITPDVARLAQVRPGEQLRFRAVSLEQARSILAEHRQCLARLEPSLL